MSHFLKGMAFWVNKKKLSALAGKTATEAKKGHSKKWYFVTNIVLTYYEKNCSSDREKLLRQKKIGIIRTIHSNSKRPEPFLVTECFFNLFLEVSLI